MFSKTYLSAIALVCTQAIKIDIEASAPKPKVCELDGWPGCEEWGWVNTPDLKNGYCQKYADLPLCMQWNSGKGAGLAQIYGQ